MPSSKRLLLRDIYHLIVGDEQGTRWRDVDLLIEDGRIAQLGPRLPRGEAEVIDCSTKLVVPGLVNTHHHMFQTLQRAVPAVQDAGLFDWLRGLYPIWAHLGAEGVSVGTQLACAELLKTGCTTTSDHHYLFPQGTQEDLTGLQVEAARQLGIRFCVTRGSMSVSQRDGGLPPDSVVQDDETILRSYESALRHHDPSPLSMQRLALAPCAPFNVSPELMRQTAVVARQHGLRLHTHIAETLDEQRYCIERYGCRPIELLDRWGWLGEDVWLAHAIYLDDAEVELLARTGTGVSHCASSNMRLGSGFCRVPELLDRGVRVSLGVDGSASNDSSDMLGELRNCLLLQRARYGAEAMSVERTLSLATRGGAAVLGWDTIGSLEPGKAADLAIFELNRLDYAGALADPLGALLLCGISHRVDTTIVNGEIVVRGGRLVRVDEQTLCDRANRVARGMLEAAGHSTRWWL